MQHELPINYKAYFMEDLVEEVMHKLTKQNFIDNELSDLRNNVNYSRVLFLIGEYQSALKELLQSQLHVEATALAVALRELGLLPTKQLIFEVLSDHSQENKQALKPFSENDFAVLYDEAFDYDGSLITMA